MAEATTYNIVGIREDLTDWLTMVDPEETPKLSTFPKTKGPTSYYQEWQMDGLDVVRFPGVLEGQDTAAFFNKAANRARVGNYIQQDHRPWAVSSLVDLTDIAGLASEKANAKAKCAIELKRDLEALIGSDQDRQADDGTVPYKLRALGNWISSSGPSDVPAAYRTPAGNIDATATASLTEPLFNGVFQSIFENVGKRQGYTLYAGTNLKKAITGFQRLTSTNTTSTYRVNQDATTHQIDLRVDMYSTDWGPVSIVPDLFNGLTSAGSISSQSKARGYVINPDLVGIGYMQGMAMYSMEFPNLGGGPRGEIRYVATLVCKNPRGLGKFAGSS